MLRSVPRWVMSPCPSKALYTMDGYVTAWFCYWLKDDQSAYDALFNLDKGIHTNRLYTGIRMVEPSVFPYING